MFCFPSLVLATENNAVVGVDTVPYEVNRLTKIHHLQVHGVPECYIVVAVQENYHQGVHKAPQY